MGPSSGAGEEDVQLRNQQHRIVADLGRRALEGDDPGWLMHDACAALADTLDLPFAGVFELTPDEHRLRMREGVGWQEGEGPVGGPAEPERLGDAVLAEGQPVVFGPGERPFPQTDRLVRHEIEAGVAVPLLSGGGVQGLVGVYATEERRFTDPDVAFVQSVANVLSSKLETEPAPLGEPETRRELGLQESARYRQKLDDIMTAPQLDVDEKIQRLLELGRERLGVENGHVVRFGVPEDRQEIVHAAGSGIVQTGSVPDLVETYCRETIGAGDIMEVPDVGETDWPGDGAYERWGIGGYVGTEIRVDDEPWGTICFVNEDPIEPLSEAQRAFANLMGRWVGQEIERREHVRRLREEKERFASLVQDVGEYAIFTLDTEGRVRSWNNGARRIKGYTETEILGRSFEVFYTDEDRETGRPQRNLEAAAEYGSVQDEGWRMRADGLRFWASVTITALHDDEGELRGFAKVTRDMTKRRNREEELRREKERFHLLVDEVEEYAIFMLDTEGQVRSWNKGARKLEGYTEAEILGRSFEVFYPEEDRDAGVPQRNLQAAAEYGSIQDEGWRVRADGSRFWANVTITALRGEDGELRGFAKIARDMTERRRRLQELQEEKERFASLVGEVEEYAIFMLDREGRVRSWNNGARRIKGYTETEILGRSFEVFYTEEDRETGRPQRNLDHAAEFGSVQDEGWRVRADGSRFWASVTITALHDDEGDVRGFAKVTRDMTKRRNRERELEESERRHRTLIENFPGGAVAMFDERLRYTVAGGELLDQLDLAGEEVVGQTVHSLHDPDVAERLADPYEMALAGDHGEAEVAIRPGREVRVQTIPVRDVDGDVYAGLVVVQDVTELKERERRLAESNERLEQFAYAASHDLQEPLRMVTTYLQLIEERYGDHLDEEGREFFAYAIDGAKRMREMIKSLLAYSRVRTEGRELTPVASTAVLDDVLDDLQLRIQATEAEITVSDLPVVAADGDQLAQVLRNLLSNALKYSGEDPPRIHVDAEPTDGHWRFSVADEGIGIPAKHQDRIFEVFRRLGDHDDADGVGIGLALCEQIVDRHGGRMWVDSEPGEGSTFHFTMPKPEAELYPAAE